MDKINKKFNLQGKQFFLTYPRCEATREELFEAISKIGEIEQYIIGQEAHKDGARHLHAYVLFSQKIRTTNCHYFDFSGYHGSYETVRHKMKTINYVRKEDKAFLSNFDPNTKEECIKNKRRDVSSDLISGRKSLREVVDDDSTLLFGLRNLEKDLQVWNRIKVDVPKISERKSYWIWGLPGTGKSTFVRNRFPEEELYEKPQSKWWCGYTDQSVVLLDDLDSPSLSHYLKIWADNFRFRAEFKGGMVTPSHKYFIVTSNYLPENLWKDDEILMKAISRRFTFCTISKDYTLRDLTDSYDIEIDIGNGEHK